MYSRQVGGDHYTKLKIQPWQVIDAWGLDFYLGNVVKYIARDKGNRLEDLKKALHYLEHRIALEESIFNSAVTANSGLVTIK